MLRLHLHEMKSPAMLTGLIEPLISIYEKVALGLQGGEVYTYETMSKLVDYLYRHGEIIEKISKDTLDRLFIAFGNTLQDKEINPLISHKILEAIALRARKWKVMEPHEQVDQQQPECAGAAEALSTVRKQQKDIAIRKADSLKGNLSSSKKGHEQFAEPIGGKVDSEFLASAEAADAFNGTSSVIDPESTSSTLMESFDQ